MHRRASLLVPVLNHNKVNGTHVRGAVTSARKKPHEVSEVHSSAIPPPRQWVRPGPLVQPQNKIQEQKLGALLPTRKQWTVKPLPAKWEQTAPTSVSETTKAATPVRRLEPGSKWSRIAPAVPPISQHKAAGKSAGPGTLLQLQAHPNLPQKPQTRDDAPKPPPPLKSTIDNEVLDLISSRAEESVPGGPSRVEPTTEDFADIEIEETEPRRMFRHDEFKKRGSIVRGEMTAIPGRVKGRADASPRTQKPIKAKKAVSPVKKPVDVYIPTTVTVSQLAKLLNIPLERLQRTMSQVGMAVESAYDHVLTAEYASLFAEEFGRNPIINDEASFDLRPSPPHPNPSTLPQRPPVITIMGHVDHGKTTLLDTLRSTSVAQGEAGGITQHIGAFSVSVSIDGGKAKKAVTFLDTPGHAAFSAMRARGASVTDIVVLVVAADDGVMPQTKEVIKLVNKDQVAVVVAVNKVDKSGADVERVYTSLVQEGIQVEALGGDVPAVEVSGLTGQGLTELVETLSAVAEIQDLRSERDGPTHGYVLESRIQKGLGAVATVLILRGCLQPGAHLLCGTANAKVRIMTDPAGKGVKSAYPGTAVTVSGWKELPKVGDEVLQGSEADVKKALNNRLRRLEIEEQLKSVDALNQQRQQEREERTKQASADAGAEVAAPSAESGPKEVKLVVKGDVSGSIEAVVGALEGIRSKDAVVKVVTTGVGDVTESDIAMAETASGMIVAFSVKVPRPIQTAAAHRGVPIYSSSIIYQIMDEVKTRVIALLPPVVEQRVTGEATVLQLFDIHLKDKKIKKVAGCRVINGMVEKAKTARVVRDGALLYEGLVDTLRHLKKDITEARKGLECGMSFDKFDNLREGDLIQFFEVIEKPGSL